MVKGKEMTEPFWKVKELEDMSREEWESLCDGCGKCCLYKLEDDETGVISFTNVACKLLDAKSCQCSDYKNRKKHVPDCQVFNAKKVRKIHWLPSTCAYRLLAEGKDLPRWHPLVSGHPSTVHKAGVSVRNKIVSETQVKNLEDFVVDWIF
jgi:uncharacterized cysteine cluster protein YcgN (CxxCxxCC family)